MNCTPAVGSLPLIIFVVAIVSDFSIRQLKEAMSSAPEMSNQGRNNQTKSFFWGGGGVRVEIEQTIVWLDMVFSVLTIGAETKRATH